MQFYIYQSSSYSFQIGLLSPKTDIYISKNIVHLNKFQRAITFTNTDSQTDFKLKHTLTTFSGEGKKDQTKGTTYNSRATQKDFGRVVSFKGLFLKRVTHYNKSKWL